jgi:cytochrome d ubiquinol oxidase subunit I
MDATDPLVLARVQFGLNIAFHILFPSLTIALGWILVYFRIQFARTGDQMWLATYQLWTKVFALSFAMGVVTGIVMSFQFGTNWPGFMTRVGNIAGPLLAYEVLTAFFLEATFLGVMLFGMNRVPGWVHVAATVFVAVGTTISAFWILALNSWMHTPTGHVTVDGVLVAESWVRVIFNPSFLYRFTHMMLASGLTAAFVVAGLSAWRLLRAPEDAAARRTLRTGVLLAAILAPAQIVVGDLHGLNTLEHQPAKIAAIEAIWKTEQLTRAVLDQGFFLRARLQRGPAHAAHSTVPACTPRAAAARRAAPPRIGGRARPKRLSAGAMLRFRYERTSDHRDLRFVARQWPTDGPRDGLCNDRLDL